MKSFDALDIRDSTFELLKNDVVITDMAFEDRVLSSGIILRNDNGTGYGIRPRWGQVYATGPEQTEVKAGDWILVEHGRWTRGVQIEDAGGVKVIRKVDPESVLLVSDRLPNDDTQSGAEHVDKK